MRKVGAFVFPSRHYLSIALVLICGQFTAAQTVVNSTLLDQPLQAPNYSDPNNWAPAEVPNNTGGKRYNVDIPSRTVAVDVDATISNLNLGGAFTGLNIIGRTFSVTGATTNQLQSGAINIQSSATAPGKFNAGTLSTFSNNVLTGNYIIYSAGKPATLQFQDANVSTLRNGYFQLSGLLAAIVDQFGNDALRNLARVENLATFAISDRSLVTNAPFSNEGSLFIWQNQTATNFTATVSLANYEPATRTIIGGTFGISTSDAPGIPAELRFNGADIVNIASTISLYGATSRIADLAGKDGLRNLARILPTGLLVLNRHSIAIAGQFQNDGSLTLSTQSVFAVAGSLTNFDPATRTLSGGSFAVSVDAQLKFAGADIVHNGAHLTLSDGGIMTDLVGNDALRNFSDNLSSGEFVVGTSTQFTAPRNFTNSGKVEMIRPLFTPRDFRSPGRFTVLGGFRYTQTGGTTINAGSLTAEHIDILAGSISGGGTFLGDVTVTNATISPSAQTIIQGNLTLSSNSHFRYQYDVSTPQDITGKVTLAGVLEVDIPSDRFLSNASVLTILKSAHPLSGVFSNAPSGARIPTTDGTGSVVVTYDTNALYVSQYLAEPPPAQLLNISGRAFLSRSDNDPFGDRAVLIGGFIISGSSEPKEVVLRGLGPSLAKFGLSSFLADPALELHASDGALLVTNDNWKKTQAAEIAASGLAPDNNREAAIRTTLQPGTYTVVLKEKNGLAGNGVVEIYDLSQNATKLANISSRGYTDSSNVLIGGIIAGNGQANADIVVRAIGPQLRKNGIFNALDDPTLEVRDTNGNIVGFNDDWPDNSDQFFDYSELTPYNSTESVVRVSLPRGNYTAIVRAKGNSGGVALVEFYDLRR